MIAIKVTSVKRVEFIAGEMLVKLASAWRHLPGSFSRDSNFNEALRFVYSISFNLPPFEMTPTIIYFHKGTNKNLKKGLNKVMQDFNKSVTNNIELKTLSWIIHECGYE